MWRGVHACVGVGVCVCGRGVHAMCVCKRVCGVCGWRVYMRLWRVCVCGVEGTPCVCVCVCGVHAVVCV